MKSLLVDALRQAKNLDEAKTLSDSGSYDTTQAGFLTTANDADVEPPDPREQELELYATINKSLQDAVAAESVAEYTPPAPQQMTTVVENEPRQAQLAPSICIALAVVAASVWLGYQQVKSSYSDSAVDMSQQQLSGDHANRMNAMVDQTKHERFPFLPVIASSDELESKE